VVARHNWWVPQSPCKGLEGQCWKNEKKVTLKTLGWVMERGYREELEKRAGRESGLERTPANVSLGATKRKKGHILWEKKKKEKKHWRGTFKKQPIQFAAVKHSGGNSHGEKKPWKGKK